jgi:aquaporin NIP
MFGTFALVFAGAGAVIIDHVTAGGVTHVGVAITFGLVVMAMIYAVGDVSGAHLNPAVTIGFFVAGRLRLRDVGPYIAAQLFGAVIASLAHRILFGNVASLGATLPGGSAMQSLILEAILTAILMFVILCVSSGPKEVGLMAGIAIGGVVGLEAMFAGPICGASMNPARSLGPALVSGALNDLWIYLLGPIAGAITAVPVWRSVRPRTTCEGVESCPQTQTSLMP